MTLQLTLASYPFAQGRAAVLAAAIPMLDSVMPLSLAIDGADIAAEHMPPTIGVDLESPRLTDQERADAREWYARRAKNHDGTSGDVASRWGIIPALADAPIHVTLDLLMSYEPERGREVRFPIQLVFDLRDRRQNTLARLISESRSFELISGLIDRDQLQEVVIDYRRRLATYGGIFLDVNASFTEVLRSCEAYSYFASTPNRVPMFWQVALGHGDLQRLPVLPVGSVAAFGSRVGSRIERMVLADLPGRGVITFMFDPLIFNHKTGDLLPDDPVNAALVVLPLDHAASGQAIMEHVAGRQGTPALRARPGWRHQAIGLSVQGGPGAPRFLCWELGVSWRDLPGSEAPTSGEALLRMLAATGKLADLPPTLWVAVCFLCFVVHHEPEVIGAWASTWLSNHGDIEALGGVLWADFLARTRKAEHLLSEPIRQGSALLHEVIGGPLVPPHLSDFTPGDVMVAILDIGPRLWRDLAGRVSRTLDSLAEPGRQHAEQLLGVLALMAAWRDVPPVLVDGTPDVGPSLLAAAAWRQQRALRHPLAMAVDADDLAWLCPDPFHVWGPWLSGDEPQPLPEGHTRRIAQLCRLYAEQAAAGVYPVAGRFEIVLRHTFPRLAALGPFTIRIAASERYRDGRPATAIWARIGPPDRAGGVTLPFCPGGEPPALWLSLLPQALAWELHLVLSAWHTDARVAGDERVLEPQPRPEGGQPRHGHGRAVHGRPATLYVPRRTLVATPGARGGRPALRGTYPPEADHEQTRHRLRSLHAVRAHTFNPRSRPVFSASPEKREAWALLDAATRLQLTGGVDFPESGTIRGLRLAEDPATGARWAEVGYTRGGHSPDGAPRPVVTRSHEGAATLIQMLDAER